MDQFGLFWGFHLCNNDHCIICNHAGKSASKTIWKGSVVPETKQCKRKHVLLNVNVPFLSSSGIQPQNQMMPSLIHIFSMETVVILATTTFFSVEKVVTTTLNLAMRQWK